MKIPFNYTELAKGVDFVGRDVELSTLSKFLTDKQNVVIYGPDGIGKRSLVNLALTNLKNTFPSTLIFHINLLNVRTEETFYRLYEERVGSHDSFSSERVIIYIEEFQNVLHFDDPDAFLKRFEKRIPEQKGINYIFSGSKTNSMRYIFKEKKYFYGMVEYLPIFPINEKVVSEYIVRTFLKVGRVIDKEYVKVFYDISGGVPYYLWVLCSTTFNMTKGFVTPDIKDDALASIISIREGHFKSLIDSLSNFQISLLRAVYDGVTQFSNKEVIDKYQLNSSANVFRLKEALKKKEVIYFDDDDIPYIIDPIFKYWLSKYYFI